MQFFWVLSKELLCALQLLLLRRSLRHVAEPMVFRKETCFGYIRPTDGSIRAVILFDQGFDVSTGIYQTGMRKGLQVLTNNRHIVLKCWTRRKCKEWMQYLKNTANSYARDFTLPNPHMSFAPMRANTHATWYVDGAQYMSAVADGLEAALEEIYIADWWLSPEIYMKRPALDGDYWRLDKILLRKAEQECASLCCSTRRLKWHLA